MQIGFFILQCTGSHKDEIGNKLLDNFSLYFNDKDLLHSIVVNEIFSGNCFNMTRENRKATFYLSCYYFKGDTTGTENIVTSRKIDRTT